MKYPAYTRYGTIEMVDEYTINDMRIVTDILDTPVTGDTGELMQYAYMIEYFIQRPEMLVGTEYGNNADEVRLTLASKKTKGHDRRVRGWMTVIEQYNSEKRM